MNRSTTWAGIIMAFVMITAFAAYGAADWPQFKGNAQNTGTASTDVGALPSTVFETAVSDGTWMCGAIIDDDANIVFLSLGGFLYSLDSAGNINWCVSGLGSGNWGGVAYDETEDAIYSTSYGASPEVFKTDADTGAILWSLATGNGGVDVTPTIASDGTVYFATYATPNEVFAVNPDGTVKWSLSVGGGYQCSAIPIYEDAGSTYLYLAAVMGPPVDGVPNNNLFCIRDDTTTGTVVWTAPVGYNWSQGTVDSNGNFYMITFADWAGQWPYNVFKIDKDGNEIWKVLPGQNSVQGSPTLSADESTLYMGGHGGSMLAMDAATGATKWAIDFDTGAEVVANNIVLSDGTVYAVVNDNPAIFYRIQDLGTKGIIVFEKTLNGPCQGTPAVAANGTVYLVPSASTVYALEPEGDTVDILTTSVANGELGLLYDDIVVAVGGDRPYAWSLDSGTLPPGLSLDAVSGEITGTPTAGGTYDFTVEVTDSTTPTPTTDTVALTIEVTFPPFEITTKGLSLAEKDVAYSDTLETSDAPLPITWSITDGTPGPFSINSSTGEITGTPTAYGDSTFKVKAVDNDANETSISVTISVLDPNTWQTFQNNKRRIGSSLVIGPGAFIPKWNSGMNLGNGSPAVQGDYVYHKRGWPNVINCLSAADGTNVWTTPDSTLDHQRQTPCIGIGDDEGMIYTGYAKTLMSVNKADGTTNWRVTNSDTPQPSAFDQAGYGVISNSRIFVNNWATTVCVVEDTGTGWSELYAQSFTEVRRAPITLLDVADDTNGDYEVMLFGSRSAGIGFFGITVANGTIGWSQIYNNTELAVDVDCCPAVSSTNDLFYGGRSGTSPCVVSLDGVTGETNWKTVLSAAEGNARRGAGALSVDQDTFYIQWVGQATPVGELVAINTDDGTVKWRYANGLTAGADGAPIYSVTVDKAGKVYFLLNDGTDYKVACVRDDGASATLIWEQTIGSSNTPASFSLGGDGTLYFACHIDGTDAVWAIKEDAPPAPEIIDMDRGSMSITFRSSTYFDYKIESSTSAYDYVESNMTWVTEIDDLTGDAISTTWTDPSPPTSGQKFYRVFAKSETFGDQASDTVGLQLVDVYNGRNLVSSPFEPYGVGFFNAWDAQVTGSVFWTTEPFDGIQWIVSPSFGTFEDDGTDKFCRTHIPAGSSHWGGYMRTYFETEGLIGGPIDASNGAVMEFDIRMYADPGNPQTVYSVQSYLSSYDSDPAHTYLGRAFPGNFYTTDVGDPYPAWQHVKIDLGVQAGDPNFSVDNIDAITIITPGCSGIVNENWIDVKDIKVTYTGDVGASTLDKIVGDQLTGHVAVRSLSDTIEAWDTTNQKYLRAWYQTGTGWKDWDVIADPPQFGLDADRGYWFNRVLSHPDTAVMLFGRVSPTARTIPIGIKRNLVGSCFPVGSTLDASGLAASGFIGHVAVRSLSDTVEFWNNATASYERFWLQTGVGFKPWNVGDPMRDIAPGDAIWVNLPLRTVGFTWTYPMP